MYIKNDIVAVIIIYYPDNILTECIKAICSQVGVVVVINNSPEMSILDLIKGFPELKIT